MLRAVASVTARSNRDPGAETCGGCMSSLALFTAIYYCPAMTEQSNAPAHQKLLIIDFGSQVTQLIARRLRELSVYCEIHPYQNVTDGFLAEFAPQAVILSGGPDSVTREGSPRAPESLWTAGLPVLGICYGQQVMMEQLGGKVEGGKISGGGGTAEFGRAFVTPAGSLNLLDGWFGDGDEQVWMSHGDHVSKLAPGFEVYGTSPNAPYAITADLARNFYAVQFHPEVHHTPKGAKLYENFVRMAGFAGDWTMGAYREQAIIELSGKWLPSVTIEWPATMEFAPIFAPSMMVAPMPINVRSPMVQPCRTTRWVMEQSSPTIVGVR